MSDNQDNTEKGGGFFRRLFGAGKRKVSLTFSVFAVTVGIGITWYAKDDNGNRQPAEKEVVVIKHNADGQPVDTLFHVER